MEIIKLSTGKKCSKLFKYIKLYLIFLSHFKWDKLTQRKLFYIVVFFLN